MHALHENSKKVIAVLLSVALLGMFFYVPLSSDAATDVNLRQEINILNRYLTATVGSQATSSEWIYIDPERYSGSVTYYLEIVASTSVSLDNDVYLRSSAGTTTCTANIPTLTTSMTLIRSSACTGMALDSYRLVIGNDAGGDTTVKAARVVVLQNFIDTSVNATSTQTQIEIGSYINASSSVTTSPAADTKYWTYASSAWDGTRTFSLHVSYQQNTQTSSSTLYTTTGTTTYTSYPGTTHTVVELWGAGGGGRCTASTAGGGGGAGGGYSRSTTTVSSGTHTIFIPQGGRCSVAAATSSATFDLTLVTANSGAGTTGSTGAGTTSTSTMTGQFKVPGGSGGAALGTNDTGGGGGGAGGPIEKGGGGVTGLTSVGGQGGTGNAGSGGVGGDGGTVGSVNGTNGAANDDGGGGGGGSYAVGNGGGGGAPGGGSGGGDTTTEHFGGRGQARIKEIVGMTNFVLQEDDGSFANWTNIASTSRQVGSATSTSGFATTSEFSPTDGRHYRLVASTTSGASYSIFNAKIVVNQAQLHAPIGSISFATGLGGTPADQNYAVLYPSAFGVASFATSSNVSPTSGTTTFTFSPAVDVTIGRTYYVGVFRTGARDTTNYLSLLGNNNDPCLGQGRGKQSSGAWTLITANDMRFSLQDGGGVRRYNCPQGTTDIGFYAQGVGGTNEAAGISITTSLAFATEVFTKLEAQYLVANSHLNSGTALQSSLTKWVSTEFPSASALFYHAVDAADNSSSVVTLNEAGGTLVASSTVTSPDNVGTSTCMTMPSDGNIDVKATTNNGDVNASRILVRVNLEGGQTCGGGGGGAVQVIIEEEVYLLLRRCSVTHYS